MGSIQVGVIQPSFCRIRFGRHAFASKNNKIHRIHRNFATDANVKIEHDYSGVKVVKGKIFDKAIIVRLGYKKGDLFNNVFFSVQSEFEGKAISPLCGERCVGDCDLHYNSGRAGLMLLDKAIKDKLLAIPDLEAAINFLVLRQFGENIKLQQDSISELGAGLYHYGRDSGFSEGAELKSLESAISKKDLFSSAMKNYPLDFPFRFDHIKGSVDAVIEHFTEQLLEHDERLLTLAEKYGSMAALHGIKRTLMSELIETYADRLLGWGENEPLGIKDRMTGRGESSAVALAIATGLEEELSKVQSLRLAKLAAV